MLDTSARLLRLLSLLQSRPDWTGSELAGRLGVTTRTVRRDVERLRQLGYPVDAQPGAAGGYRLGAGATLPPLLLDDDEATAVAIALGASAGGAVRGIEEPALAALAKLDRLLPPRLRDRVSAVRATTVRMAAGTDDVDAATLVTIAQAGAGQERLRLDYRDRQERRTGGGSIRTGWCARAGAGTWWPTTPTGASGGPFGSTGSSTSSAPATASGSRTRPTPPPW